ncbi:MAG: RagB/SusD family nutrient uptake outer membrane protein [Bacteroidales bacterium]|jgi:hypothetical protein|nr:RagB/SusD family nutrient uptake outer membrane protein [Bacteroidales bacterium]
MKKNNIHFFKHIVLIFALCATQWSCKDYLNVVPDDIPVIENAFANRYQAEGFLYGCYGTLPLHFSPNRNPALLGGDEIWLFEGISGDVINTQMWGIARGEQGTELPVANCWASKQDTYDRKGGFDFFTALRDCNIFLENIHIPADMNEEERQKWIGEVKFLKAYYHFWLLRMYGPIPLIRENMPISVDPEDAKVYREPVDSVANYIVQLLDEAMETLPMEILNLTEELGRATKPAAAALKGQVLLWVASPLLNGNKNYTDIRDSRGIQLFPDTLGTKWLRAAEALKEAIDMCEGIHGLYSFSESGVPNTQIDSSTFYSMRSRGAATERWNREIIWGESPRGDFENILQRLSFPAFSDYQQSGHLQLCYAPTLQIVEQFYSKNGVPLEEDKDWVGVDRFGLQTRTAAELEHKFYIAPNYKTINLHFNREPRFYGAITFDGGLFYGNGATPDNAMKTTKFPYGANGRFLVNKHSATGYLCKKVIPRLTGIANEGTQPTYYSIAFPIIRLADLYLMYAEALNEWEGPNGANSADLFHYIDVVRKGSGLKGVKESWTTYAIDAQKNKFTTKEGMRNIIQRERLIELAFEGARFWDLRRWNLAESFMNRPIRGLNKLGATPELFYQETVLYQPSFGLKDYLWPLRQDNLLKNNHLKQNPGWE